MRRSVHPFVTLNSRLDSVADIVERYTLSLMLFAVALRNLIELSGSEFDFSEGIVLPTSFGWFRGGSLIWTIFYVSALPYHISVIS